MSEEQPLSGLLKLSLASTRQISQWQPDQLPELGADTSPDYWGFHLDGVEAARFVLWDPAGSTSVPVLLLMLQVTLDHLEGLHDERTE